MEYLKRFEEPFRVCYEASCGYGPLHDRLSMTADEVLVAHPGHLRLSFRSKKKNDRVDAQKLATLRSARFQVSLGEVRITSSDGVFGTHR